MDTILNDGDFAIAYPKNILLKSVNWEQYAKHDKEVFEKKQYGLKLSVDKYAYF